MAAAKEEKDAAEKKVIMNRKSELVQGMKDGIPIALGYLAVSFTFGMMAVSSGISVWESVLISFSNVTSAGQFAGLDIIAASGTYIEMILTQFIINLRYSLMAFSMSQKLNREESFMHRFVVAFGLTDEIFGISAAREGKVSAWYNYGAMCVAIPGWVLGTLIGAISGNLLPEFIVSALSVAIYGMFMAIIIPPAKKDHAVLIVVIAAMIMSTLFSVVPVLKEISPGFVIIITTVLVAGVMSWLHPIKIETEDSGAKPSESE